MATRRSQSTGRKQRSDAKQYRERILAVAREAFTPSGANASLDDIAKQTGVGAGTLYRHFPSREELPLSVRSLLYGASGNAPRAPISF
jgi:AcrR family transcriptional regulator